MKYISKTGQMDFIQLEIRRFLFDFLLKVSTSPTCFTVDHVRKALLYECYLTFIYAMHKSKAVFSLMIVPIHV